MKSDPLDSILRALGNEPLPVCPDHLAIDVWQEISRRRKPSRWALLPSIRDWQEVFARPHLAIGALACAVIIGTMPAIITTQSKENQLIARSSIHFDVFSSNAPAGLGAPLLSRPVTSPSSL